MRELDKWSLSADEQNLKVTSLRNRGEKSSEDMTQDGEDLQPSLKHRRDSEPAVVAFKPSI